MKYGHYWFVDKNRADSDGNAPLIYRRWKNDVLENSVETSHLVPISSELAEDEIKLALVVALLPGDVKKYFEEILRSNSFDAQYAVLHRLKLFLDKFCYDLAASYAFCYKGIADFSHLPESFCKPQKKQFALVDDALVYVVLVDKETALAIFLDDLKSCNISRFDMYYVDINKVIFVNLQYHYSYIHHICRFYYKE